jgi:hypothetical protein
MTRLRAILTGTVLLVATAGSAQAWFHGGGTTRWGGHYGASGTYGDWHAGGTTATGHTWGATGSGRAWTGASSSGWHGGGYDGHWAAAGPDGHWATGTRWAGGAAGWGYHPPTVVNHYYGAGGCWGCGGWPGPSPAGAAAVGLVAGAAIGAAAANAAARPVYTTGTIYAALPAGCAYSPYGGAAYWSCNGAWFRPSYGANGTYYQVVPAPSVARSGHIRSHIATIF